MGVQNANQSPIITQKYLNTEAYTGDPAPFSPVSTALVSGSIVQTYDGAVGTTLTLTSKEAADLSDPTATLSLQGGVFQYVKFYLSSSGSNAAGQVVFWKSPSTYANPGNVVIGTVTPDATANPADVAGITLGAPAKGYYWFIQIAGVAAVKFYSAITAATPAIGDVVSLYSATSNLADDPTQSGTQTIAQAKLSLGIALQVPVLSSLKLVRLFRRTFNE